MTPNTLFLRLEGPLQAWGDHHSRFVLRRTAQAPTKSGVTGLLCAALGASRQNARNELPMLNGLMLGVRIDRPGVLWCDYHTAGANTGNLTAEGKLKRTATTGQIETLVTRREYLCDASFLVALQGDPPLIQRLYEAVRHPVWPIFLGRKCCPPALPLLGAHGIPDCETFPDLMSALAAAPWHPRYKDDPRPNSLECLVEWRPSPESAAPPDDAELHYDVALSFDMPAHQPRWVLRRQLPVGQGGVAVGQARQRPTPRPPRPRADYGNTQFRTRRQERLQHDQGLCVFCKCPGYTVQHVTYRRAGGQETLDDLRTLCRLCHDAVTMIEYGHNMGLDRINPEDQAWRELIIQKCQEIIRFRSLETRRRWLRTEETP